MEIEELWGIPIEELKTKGKKKDRIVKLLFLLNILGVIGLSVGSILFHIQGVFLICTIIVVVFWYVPVLQIMLKDGYINAYRFYKSKYKAIEVINTINLKVNLLEVLQSIKCRDIDAFYKEVRNNKVLAYKIYPKIVESRGNDKIELTYVRFKGNKHYILSLEQKEN